MSPRHAGRAAPLLKIAAALSLLLITTASLTSCQTHTRGAHAPPRVVSGAPAGHSNPPPAQPALFLSPGGAQPSRLSPRASRPGPLPQAPSIPPLAPSTPSLPRSTPPTTTPHTRDARAQRVDKILARLLPHVPPGLCREYGIVTSAVPNASIDHRGVLKITTGLLRFAETDALLAFALAHELSHAALGHPRRQRRNGILQALLTGAIVWAAAEAADSKSSGAFTGAGFFLSTAFFGTLPAMRRMELEADRSARELLIKAGYPPETGAAFWQRYARARPHRPLPVWLSGHPSDARRVRQLSVP